MENPSQLWLLSWLKIILAKPKLIYRELGQKLRLTSIKKSRCAKDVYIAPSVQVLGWGRVRIGLGSVISDHTWINVNDRQANTNAVIVGSFCFIGRRNFLSSGDVIKIGDYCLTGPNCNFLGADHVYTSPLVPYIATGVTRGGSIEIGANCWLGADVTILKNVKIGYGSIIGAGTVVNKDIPPLSVVVGNPGRVIKRFNLQQQAWISAKEYSDENDRNLMSEADYLEMLNKTKIDLRGYRVASSQSFGDL